MVKIITNKYDHNYNNSVKCIRIGTDCSGIEAPLQALQALQQVSRKYF